MLFEGGFYLFDGWPTHVLTMEVQNGHCAGGLARLPSIAVMIMKDNKVVALAMFPASYPEYSTFS